MCSRYLERLRALATRVLVMTSAGGLVPLGDAATRPASLLLSGPVAGVRAAASVATACGFPDSVSFESYNYPGAFLRHRGTELWVDPSDGSPGFRDDASFRPLPPLAG